MRAARGRRWPSTSCDNYPQIADPADPSYNAECDPGTVTVLGDYIGSQMAGFNVEAVLGTIDHVQDGELDVPYTARTVVVGGNTPYVTTVTAGDRALRLRLRRRRPRRQRERHRGLPRGRAAGRPGHHDPQLW
jgi:hypothetical protein